MEEVTQLKHRWRSIRTIFFSSRKFFAILRVDEVKITSSKNKIVEWNSLSSNKKSTLVNRAD